ncbi:MAG: hypothetical protein OXG39_06130 [Chloroflexi bacterium]|nr:hypothetical protein [Chloroflexota bacterium]
MYNPLADAGYVEMNGETSEMQFLDARYYLSEVYPRLKLPLPDAYPLVRLDSAAGYHSLGSHPLLMLVALTGTGKSTTLACLRQNLGPEGMGVIPSRRELADWIALPMMQTLNGEATRPVADRVRRFAYTRSFAERVPGGMAAAFSWLYLADSFSDLVIAEGIRGGNEMRHALTRFPAWRIVELTLDPLTRLRRLSERRDRFDRAAGAADLSFLPCELREEAQTMLAAGEIDARAIAIMGAEVENYGLLPFAAGHQYRNYHRIAVDQRSPEQVAREVAQIVEAIANAQG